MPSAPNLGEECDWLPECLPGRTALCCKGGLKASNRLGTFSTALEAAERVAWSLREEQGGSAEDDSPGISLRLSDKSATGYLFVSAPTSLQDSTKQYIAQTASKYLGTFISAVEAAVAVAEHFHLDGEEKQVPKRAGGLDLYLSSKSSTGYCGVYSLRSGRFEVRAASTGEYLGVFDTPTDAAICYAKNRREQEKEGCRGDDQEEEIVVVVEQQEEEEETSHAEDAGHSRGNGKRPASYSPKSSKASRCADEATTLLTPAPTTTLPRGVAGFVQKLGKIRDVLGIDASISNPAALSKANALMGLHASDGKPFPTQADDLLQMLGIDQVTLAELPPPLG